jgi:hypothetical protein
MGRWVKQVTPPSLPKPKQLNCEDRIQAAISGVTHCCAERGVNTAVCDRALFAVTFRD